MGKLRLNRGGIRKLIKQPSSPTKTGQSTEGVFGSWSKSSASLLSESREHSDPGWSPEIGTDKLEPINTRSPYDSLECPQPGWMKLSLWTACLRHGATLSKAYLNIALLPSKCNPNPHFYPWKPGGRRGPREVPMRGDFHHPQPPFPQPCK